MRAARRAGRASNGVMAARKSRRSARRTARDTAQAALDRWPSDRSLAISRASGSAMAAGPVGGEFTVCGKSWSRQNHALICANSIESDPGGGAGVRLTFEPKALIIIPNAVGLIALISYCPPLTLRHPATWCVGGQPNQPFFFGGAGESELKDRPCSSPPLMPTMNVTSLLPFCSSTWWVTIPSAERQVEYPAIDQPLLSIAPRSGSFSCAITIPLSQAGGLAGCCADTQSSS